MLILVSGENNSGKSNFAESLAVKLNPRPYYIATMLPYGEEGRLRVEKHLAQRAGFNFVTIEEAYFISKLAIPTDSVVLLEDVSNLLANVKFDQARSAAHVLADIEALSQQVNHIIVVTISHFETGDYSEETRQYMEDLTWLNGELFLRADLVVKMQKGKAVCIKGALNELA